MLVLRSTGAGASGRRPRWSPRGFLISWAMSAAMAPVAARRSLSASSSLSRTTSVWSRMKTRCPRGVSPDLQGRHGHPQEPPVGPEHQVAPRGPAREVLLGQARSPAAELLSRPLKLHPEGMLSPSIRMAAGLAKVTRPCGSVVTHPPVERGEDLLVQDPEGGEVLLHDAQGGPCALDALGHDAHEERHEEEAEVVGQERIERGAGHGAVVGEVVREPLGVQPAVEEGHAEEAVGDRVEHGHEEGAAPPQEVAAQDDEHVVEERVDAVDAPGEKRQEGHREDVPAIWR